MTRTRARENATDFLGKIPRGGVFRLASPAPASYVFAGSRGLSVSPVVPMKHLSMLHSASEERAEPRLEEVDFSSLALRLPGPEAVGPGSVHPRNATGRMRALVDLRAAIHRHQSEVLFRYEWPAVLAAWHCASRNEARELIALDQALNREPRLAPLAAASQRIGRLHLKRLRPLRDQRVVTRYLAALDRGEAAGWHMLVYGLLLHVYSLPLRQGLLHFARQTTEGFIAAAAERTELREDDGRTLLAETEAVWPAQLNALLAPTDPLAVAASA